MKIIVLNGSPKGETSVTMQYVKYMQKVFPAHEFEIVSVAQQIKHLENDEARFQQVIERVRAADGVLWAFPLYILLVHAGYKRFIELIWERGVEDAFRGKATATLSTSIHFFDNTAHDYMRAICDDLRMRYVGAFSPEMGDLLEKEGPAKTATFAGDFLDAIEQNLPMPRAYAPLVRRTFEYIPGPMAQHTASGGKRILIVTDVRPEQINLQRMIDHLRAAWSGEVETINLRDLDIKGSCLGCLQCGYDNVCAYTGKDDFIEFYKTHVERADILVYAGAMADRFLSSTWKTYFDRSFFNTHTPTLIGKQFLFLISGPLGQATTLRQVLEAWTQIQRSNVVGFVGDDEGDSAHMDALIESMAARAVRFAQQGYIAPQNFLGVGGMKIFRDDVWGRLRIVFQADHRAYKRLGIYDFPQRSLSLRLMNAVISLLFRLPKIRTEFTRRIRSEMVKPYQRVLEG